jgi:transcriptional regulator with XRE-family HTH domain
MRKHPLKSARLSKGLTLQSLADQLQLGKTTVARWEQGIHVPTRFYADAIAEKLGFPSGQEVRRLCTEWQKEQGICNCKRSRLSSKAETP